MYIRDAETETNQNIECSITHVCTEGTTIIVHTPTHVYLYTLYVTK